MNINKHKHLKHFERIPSDGVKYSLYEILYKYTLMGYDYLNDFGWKYTDVLNEYEIHFDIYNGFDIIDSYIGKLDVDEYNFKSFDCFDNYMKIIIKVIKRNILIDEILE